MRAGQVSGPGKFEVVEVADPAPAEGQILVSMRSASICGSDLHLVFAEDGLGTYPLPPGRPGHEGVGVVVDSRSAKHSPGEMVLTVPVAGAGAAYAELQVVGEDFAITLPPDADLDRALMAQQLGTVVFGWHRYWPDRLPAAGLRAGVIGAGSAGLFALQLARLAGFDQVVISDLEPSRLKVAEKLGAARTVLAPKQSFVEAVKDLTDGTGLDLVVDATGFDACRADCVESVRYHGRIGFFGLPEKPGLVPFPLSGAFRKGCTIEMAGVAQLEPGLKAFREALDLIASGKVDVDSMIEQRYPLERFPEAMSAARAHVAPKVNVDIAPR
jgi:L-iditol 2-dehydrogenase